MFSKCNIKIQYFKIIKSIWEYGSENQLCLTEQCITNNSIDIQTLTYVIFFKIFFFCEDYLSNSNLQSSTQSRYGTTYSTFFEQHLRPLIFLCQKLMYIHKISGFHCYRWLLYSLYSGNKTQNHNLSLYFIFKTELILTVKISLQQGKVWQYLSKTNRN